MLGPDNVEGPLPVHGKSSAMGLGCGHADVKPGVIRPEKCDPVSVTTSCEGADRAPKPRAQATPTPTGSQHLKATFLAAMSHLWRSNLCWEEATELLPAPNTGLMDMHLTSLRVEGGPGDAWGMVDTPDVAQQPRSTYAWSRRSAITPAIVLEKPRRGNVRTFIRDKKKIESVEHQKWSTTPDNKSVVNQSQSTHGR